jgi:hypothetical protein
MKKNLLRYFVAFLVLTPFVASAQTVQITSNPNQSTNIVIGPSAYHVSENIYTEAEIGAANFTSAATAINRIDFKINVVGSPTTVNNYRIYLKDVPLTTTSFGTGVYSTTGYTLVFDGTFNANALGWVGVDLTTPFVRTTGNNLQVLIERLNNTTHTNFTFAASVGVTGATRRENTNTAPESDSTSLNTTSSFRPQIQLKHTTANDGVVRQVFTLGKLPIPYATPHVMSANIFNNGVNPISNLNVTLNITGANTFSNVQTITSLAPGASTTVNFAAFSPANLGTNNVSVSIPSDDDNTNNSSTLTQQVTNSIYNYAYTNTPSSSVGLLNNTGSFVAMFTTNTPTSINQVGVRFTSNGVPFTIGIWDKSGGGVPGALLWESDILSTTPGLFTIPIPSPVTVEDTFYVGVNQITASNIGFAYEAESPIRPGTFFVSAPLGNNNWSDFSPGNNFRLMIEPRLTLANDVGIAKINNPLSAATIDNCGIAPEATVVNFGSNDQPVPFNVTFNINEGNTQVYTSTKLITLTSGESATVVFDPYVSAANAVKTARVFTSLATDEIAVNDTITINFTTALRAYSDSTAITGGYSFANSTNCASPSPNRPTYNWITNTSNEINWGVNGDDSVWANPVTLPFPFKYYGTTYNQFWICSNGWISFTNPTALSASTIRTPLNIPTSTGVQNFVAGIFADLDLTPGTYPDARTYYGSTGNQFVITFEKARLFDFAPQFVTFQIILDLSGDIFVQYNDQESSIPTASLVTNSCLAGIENADGTRGISYRYLGNGGSIFDNGPLAIRYIAPVTPVPVTLLSFDATRTLQGNKASWTTTQEINSRQFTVQHSTDNRQYSNLATLAAAGTSLQSRSYQFVHQNPAKGINYYRLKMEDLDGKTTYSSIRTVRNNANLDVVIYPVPVKEQLQLAVYTDKAAQASIIVVNAQGIKVMQKQVLLQNGTNNFSYAAGKLSAGTYVLQVQLPTQTLQRSFIKN